jgi:hypothetical protein
MEILVKALFLGLVAAEVEVESRDLLNADGQHKTQNRQDAMHF